MQQRSLQLPQNHADDLVHAGVNGADTSVTPVAPFGIGEEVGDAHHRKLGPVVKVQARVLAPSPTSRARLIRVRSGKHFPKRYKGHRPQPNIGGKGGGAFEELARKIRKGQRQASLQTVGAWGAAVRWLVTCGPRKGAARPFACVPW